MTGYAIVYINDNVQEYNIGTSSDNLIDSMTVQTTQNLVIDNIDNSEGTVTIDIRRNLTSSDSEDFEFKLTEYKDCYPFLLTVAIGSGLTFTADTNTHGSSYVYIYDKDDELDTTTYVQTWDAILGRSDMNTEDRYFNVTFSMDINSQKVEIKVEDGNNTNTRPRAWGLSFPDLADTAYYHPANPDPINMDSGYSMVWGKTDNAEGFVPCGANPWDANVTEARLPVDGTTCDGLTPDKSDPPGGSSFTECWDELPIQQVVLNSYADLSGIETFEITIPFKSCGYEFNPYEYKTCRPFTIVSMAVNHYSQCIQETVYGGTGAPPSHPIIQHVTNKIQIDDYPTREPTKAPTNSPTLAPSIAPSFAPSIAPTQPPSNAPSLAPSISPSFAPSIAPTQPPSVAPSLAPSLVPTAAPVSPTRSPTEPTRTPTNAPSIAPTGKPTDLPTVNVTTLDFPPCPGLRIKHLDVLFPVEQSVEEFNQMPQIYNRRRTWSNGILSVHFEDRFEDGGDWIITNGTYTAISIEDANDNNSLVYNTSNPNIIAPHSLPGPYPDGYVYYDHFPHDNILSKPDQEVTLHFECYTTGHPTGDPTPSPTTAHPTDSPTSLMPTIAPTANCTGWCIRNIWALECVDKIANLFYGCALKKEDIDFHASWIGVGDIEGYIVHFNPFHSQWIIDGVDEYSAVATTGSSKYPPKDTIWNVFDQNNPFAKSCMVRMRYVCYGTGIPTEAPTKSPTTAYPTTNMPTPDPTNAPSDAPTDAPSYSPSLTPTTAPTGSPIVDCLGFELQNTDYLDGLYARQPNLDPITNKYYWHKIKGDGRIFWSSSSLHESWIIHSEIEQRYWLSDTKPFLQPALINTWQLYLGASPFIEDTRTLTLLCFNTLPPTSDPTEAPSLTPTLAPSIAPSITPTQPPSYSPSNAPSASPTPKPTTDAPTENPTFDPTHMPTEDPTAEPCDFLIISNPLNAAELTLYPGVYNQDSETQWNKNSIFYLFTGGGRTWRITNSINALVLQADGGPKRPPYFANYWQFTAGIAKNYSLNIECSPTNVPTNAPTMAPSLAPSMAPTSSCKGLYFNNTNMPNYKWNGWYSRQNDYFINNHRYWIKQDNLATIAYINGHWYLSEKDNDIIDDEDPIMLTMDGASLLSPPSGQWLYADESPDDFNSATANITITCIGTRFPTESPTLKPSDAPTEYIPLTWKFCPDWRPYFTFISNVTSAVYWPIPVINEHDYIVNISVEPVGTEPGDDIDTPGTHQIIYTATDNSGFTNRNSIRCMVTIYVIGNIKYSNSYEYCKRERFHIDLQFNDSYYKLDDDKEEKKDKKADESNINHALLKGIVYDPELQIDVQNCYVSAQQISNYDTIHVEDEPGKSTFLGMEAVNLVWEILVLLLIIILICLIIDCLYRLYKDKKNAQKKKDEANEQLLQDQQQLSDKDDKDDKDEFEQKEQGKSNTGDIEMQKRERINTGDDD